MKPPTRPQGLLIFLLHSVFLLVVVGHVTEGVSAYHQGNNKNHHHEVHHHQGGHHEGHHHSASHHGVHHGVRAPRTRREKEATENSNNGQNQGSSNNEEEITCTTNDECSGIEGSYCNVDISVCDCPVSTPIKDSANGVCVKRVELENECNFDSQCDGGDEYSYCGPEKVCICKEEYKMEKLPDFGFSCLEKHPSKGPGTPDPAMIGVLVGLALMFVIICVVLRLFSKARFRENRSIFNTPNPRLMNASLFKDSGVAGRRGSAMSAVSTTGSVAQSGGGAPKTPSPAKETKTKSETTVAIENVD